QSDSWTGVGDLTGHKWHLNLLAINGEYVNVPTTFNKGDYALTTLSTGENIRVELTAVNDSGVWWNRHHIYSVTVTNIHHNIEVTDGNFKNDERNEIIIKRLDGV